MEQSRNHPDFQQSTFGTHLAIFREYCGVPKRRCGPYRSQQRWLSCPEPRPLCCPAPQNCHQGSEGPWSCSALQPLALICRRWILIKLPATICSQLVPADFLDLQPCRLEHSGKWCLPPGRPQDHPPES